jgi:hypothetical protein
MGKNLGLRRVEMGLNKHNKTYLNKQWFKIVAYISQK